MTDQPRYLDFADGVQLPLNAVTQTFAFLARRGAGKTYAAMKLAEEMLQAALQIISVDPIGVWFGLRLARDGKRPGMSIPVFGGDHGDLPLDPDAGAAIADLIVDLGISAVLDVSMMRKGQRKKFVADFAEQLFHRKKQRRSPLHIFFEEAHVFAPQRVAPDETRMLGALEDIVKLGRNLGIGSSLIDQRPQAVNKDLLNLTECLIALQTTGPHERKALKEWVGEKGLAPEMVDELPSLPIGTAYLWSPQWLTTFKRIQINKKTTYDSSATPEVGAQEVERGRLAPVDVEAIRTAMGDIIARAEEEDPKRLRRRVAELEAELGSARQPAGPVVDTALVHALGDSLEAACAAVRDASKKWLELAAVLTEEGPATAPSSPPRAAIAADPRVADTKLRAGERRMLDVLATAAPEGRTRTQLGTLSGFAARGGTFRAYLGTLLRSGLATERDQHVSITRAGLSSLGSTPKPQTSEDVIQMWRRTLRAGERAMLDKLVIHRAGLSKGTLAQFTGFASDGGTFRAYLGTLRRNGLVTVEGDIVTASPTLFSV